MSNQALTVNEQHVERVGDTRIAEYQDRSLVRELTSRLMSFHPAAREVGERGMLEAAQLAILMGASPIPSTNEIHIYKDNRGATTIQIGINYWRRRAIAYGGVHWVQRPRPMTVDETEMYGVTPDKRAAICKAARQADIDRLQEQGLSLVDARASTTIIGLGEAHTGTYNTKHGSEYVESKNGRPLMWTAMKRAETDVLKQLFPYIPGEQLEPGMGLRRSETGQIVLDDHKLMHAGDNQAAEDYGRRIAAERPGYTAADANADFFDGEYTIVIEGEDEAPEQEQMSLTSMLDGMDVEDRDAWWAALEPAERDAYKATDRRVFFGLVARSAAPGFRKVTDVRTLAGKLQLDIPTGETSVDGECRIEAWRFLVRATEELADGVALEDIQAALVDEEE